MEAANKGVHLLLISKLYAKWAFAAAPACTNFQVEAACISKSQQQERSRMVSVMEPEASLWGIYGHTRLMSRDIEVDQGCWACCCMNAI
jgi:hypothetical protein